MKEDEEFSIIIGKPFLGTAHALEDIHDSKLTLWVGDEDVTFGVNKKSINFEANNDVLFIGELDKDMNKEDERVMSL